MAGNRVYIGGVPRGTTEGDLEHFFRRYGRSKEILLKRGFAFVEFEDRRDADDAVYDLNGTKLLGERVTVDIARGMPRGRDQLTARRNGRRSNRAPTRTGYRLIVENLSSSVSWQDLKDHMREAGEVTYADAHKQRRNEGVVEFASHYEMKKAIQKLDNLDLNGRRIRLVEDKNSRDRRGGSASSRSRSRNRSVRRTRSRSSARRSRSRSHSKRNSRSKTKSRSRSFSRDRRSRSRSKSRTVSVDRSRSNSSEKSVGPSHLRCNSRSSNKSRSRSASKSRKMLVDRSRSTDRSNSAINGRRNLDLVL